MLKLRDDADFKELEKMGFKPRYDEHTGEIVKYEKITAIFSGTIIEKKEIKKKLSFTKWPIKNVWVIAKYDSYFDEDALYDLSVNGLIEKIEGKIPKFKP